MGDLEDYQQRFVMALGRVIAASWLRKRPVIRVLDMGCDCSGRQLREIVKLIGGTAVGINIPADFPTAEAVATAGNRVQLLRMDGCCVKGRLLTSGCSRHRVMRAGRWVLRRLYGISCCSRNVGRPAGISSLAVCWGRSMTTRGSSSFCGRPM